MLAAANALSQLKIERLVVAVPVGVPETCRELRAIVDELVCLHCPAPFHGVGLWYRDFSQTIDEAVRHILEKAAVWEKTVQE
jgi:putative phosphoribosyl transferase